MSEVRENPVQRLSDFGQSVWMDQLSRRILDTGRLQQLIDDVGLRGVTSNPAIFEKAIAGSRDYDEDIVRLSKERRSADQIVDILTIEDVRRGADVLKGVHDQTGGLDGYVSLEVVPRLARDTEATVTEARRLWREVDRPNVMIKVPGTAEGIPAIRRLTAEGVNVNVTLLFGLPRYRQTIDAYMSGLEDHAEAGGDLGRIASVASFFLSRIDTEVDGVLEQRARAEDPEAGLARETIGEVAIACACAAYAIYEEAFAGERFRRLAARGARTQRLLWASTSTKNPAYSDVKYVEALIAPYTINTMPIETIEAYRDHGRPEADRIRAATPKARRVLETLPRLGIDIDTVAARLEEEGIEKFTRPFEKLLSAVEERSRALTGGPA